jgi:hypothetical protein
VEPSKIEGQPSQGRREAALGQAVARVDSWQNFTDIRCESSNPSFIFIDEVPGLGVVGQNYEDLLDRLKVIAANLFRARGETVTDIKIIPTEKPALQVFH